MIQFFDDTESGHDDLRVADAGVASSIGIVCDTSGVAVDECSVCFDGASETECVEEFFFGVAMTAGNGVGDFAEPEAGTVDELDALGFEMFEEACGEHVPADDDGGFAELSIENWTF